MPYKDPEKRREANRRLYAKHRERRIDDAMFYGEALQDIVPLLSYKLGSNTMEDSAGSARTPWKPSIMSSLLRKEVQSGPLT